MYGASLDLHKAFNTLSRPVLRKMCARLGLDSIWAPYESFLGGLQRYFTLQQQWSQPIQSNTGVPEGCPLSVVMMLITTWAITGYLRTSFPYKPMSSYVDDWTVRDTTPEKLVEQLDTVRDAASAVGLSLSTKKTVSYATSAPARKRLAACLKNKRWPCSVSDTGTSLGMQFQARAAKVTDLREKRVTDATPKLKRLKIMPWSSPKKATLLLTGVFPTMLHGCEFHDMGLHFISHIRSQCNGAVWKDKPYLSHFLTPLLSTRPIYEPWLWILKRVYHSFRRLVCLQPEATRQLWNIAVTRPPAKHTVGLVTILMAHLRRLGWSLGENYQCDTADGLSFALDKISCWQYKKRVIAAWQTWLVPKLKIKHHMADLEAFDVEASCWQNPDPQAEGFLATLRSGGLFTNKVKAQISSAVSANCVICGEPDSMTHRIYHCCAAEEIRSTQGVQYLADMSKAKLLWGLFPQPPAQERLARQFDRIQIHDLPMFENQQAQIHLFTDGSCTQPPATRKSERHASYAVRRASPDGTHSDVIASGVLPGRKQTPFRAELFGFTVALSVSLNSIIYTDCRAVYLGIVRLLRDGWDPVHWLSIPDADMWRTTYDILSYPNRRVSVQWIESHRQLEHARSARDAWRIYQNNMVDRSASTDANPLTGELRHKWNELVKQNKALQLERDNATNFLRTVWQRHADAEAASVHTTAAAS